MAQNQLNQKAVLLTKAIAMQEGGGKYLPYTAKSGDVPNANVAGGRYQFMPKTWKNYSRQVLGNSNAPMTPENQNKVAYTKINGWLTKGATPAQAASMWNAGEGAPNAWKPGTKQKVGNTPQYVKNVQKYGQQLSQQTQKTQQSQQNGNGYVSIPNLPTPQSTQGALTTPGQLATPIKKESLLQKTGDVVKGVGNFLFPIVGDVYNDFTGKSKKTTLQQAGDLGLSALPFIPGLGGLGIAGKVAEGAGTLAKVIASPLARGAAVGYGAGVASNLASGKSIPKAITPNVSNVGGAILGGAAPIVMKGLSSVINKAAGIDPQVLNELKRYGTQPSSNVLKRSNEYIQATKAHANNLNVESAYTMSAHKLDTAARKVEATVKEAGRVVGQTKKEVGNQPIKDINPVIDNFNNKVDEMYGVSLVTGNDGSINAIRVPGRFRKIPNGALNRIVNVAKQLQSLKNGTLRQASDIASNISDTIDRKNINSFGKSLDPLAGLFTSTDGAIRGVINETSNKMAQANATFSGLKALEKEIAGMAGTKLDRGALLMRRVFSGDKSGEVQNLFQKIKAVTGIDLTQEAVLAKHAIDIAGSKADKTLLGKMIGSARPGGLFEGALHVAQGVAKKFASPERIGKRLLKGKSAGIYPGLITKGSALTGTKLPKNN